MFHLSVACLVDLLNLKLSNLGDFCLLLVLEYVKHMLDVKQKSLVRVQSSFLKQVVVCLLQISKSQIVLDKFAAWA